VALSIDSRPVSGHSPDAAAVSGGPMAFHGNCRSSNISDMLQGVPDPRGLGTERQDFTGHEQTS